MIQSIDSKIRASRLKSAAPRQPSEAKDINIRMLLERRSGLVEELRKNDPELADIYGVSTKTLASTRKRLHSNDPLLYTIPSRAGEPLRWLEITVDGAKVTTHYLTHRDLRKKLSAFRDAAKLGTASSSDQKRILAAISKSLRIEDWGSKDAVYIVPSGQLYFVPWGALSIFAPVAILPNGGWIARAPNSSNQSTAVILGDPNFHGALPQLKGARAEAMRVSKHYGTDPLIGSSATNQLMRREVGQSFHRNGFRGI